jgi:hypothetical protein
MFVFRSTQSFQINVYNLSKHAYFKFFSLSNRGFVAACIEFPESIHQYVPYLRLLERRIFYFD